MGDLLGSKLTDVVPRRGLCSFFEARCQAFHEAPDGGDVGRSPDHGVPHEPGQPSGPPETNALDSEQPSPCGLAAEVVPSWGTNYNCANI
ncbi:hypothetical protein J6590_058308 [Homalodisca vitripennis]|nr:hypothetical protein J6590_058308 [Homalodisca vitripennis]